MKSKRTNSVSNIARHFFIQNILYTILFVFLIAYSSIGALSGCSAGRGRKAV
jgi:hypothetical protein